MAETDTVLKFHLITEQTGDQASSERYYIGTVKEVCWLAPEWWQCVQRSKWIQEIFRREMQSDFAFNWKSGQKGEK